MLEWKPEYSVGVESVDLPTLVTVSALMAGAAALAAWVPAVQATRVDPQQALREG